MGRVTTVVKITLMAAVAVISGCSDGAEKLSPTSEVLEKYHGTNIADLAFKTLDGDDTLLSATTGTQPPIIVNVWATWCTPCVKEMPSLAKLARQGEGKVVTIATDRDPQKVKTFLDEYGVADLTVLWDEMGRTTRAEMGALALPQTYILDKGLTIRGIEAGERDWSHPKMVEKIKKISSYKGQ